MTTVAPATTTTDARHVLQKLMDNLGVSDAELAGLIGSTTRQTIYNRRTGKVAIRLDDIVQMAEVLGVDPSLFLGTPIDAVQWLIDNRPEVFEPGFALQGKCAPRSYSYEPMGNWPAPDDQELPRRRYNLLDLAA